MPGHSGPDPTKGQADTWRKVRIPLISAQLMKWKPSKEKAQKAENSDDTKLPSCSCSFKGLCRKSLKRG